MKLRPIHGSVPALALALVAALAATADAQVAPGNACPTNDCVAYKIDTQPVCTEEIKSPQGKAAGWDVGLATDLDRKNYGGTIVAYQIQWGNGSWSGWYAKGQNDIDWKYNPGPNTLRRVWSYFTDHNHKILICR